MEIIYLPQSEEDLDYWMKTGNKAILKKIAQLTRAITENPTKELVNPGR